VHLTYIWIVSHLSAKNYRNWWKLDEVLTKTNLLSFFGTQCSSSVSRTPWLIKQGLTSHQTHYRLYRGRFLQAIWPNQQCQSTEGNQLVLQIRLESHQDHSAMLQ